MKKLTSILFFFIILIVIFLACSKSSGRKCNYDSIPFSLILKISKSGIALSDSQLNDSKLSYYDGNTKRYISDFTISADTANRNMGLIASRLIGILSADNKIKTYYIEYPNSLKMDTIYVDYSSPSPATNCLYVENPIRLNGQFASIDNSFHFDSPVFIISKP